MYFMPPLNKFYYLSYLITQEIAVLRVFSRIRIMQKFGSLDYRACGQNITILSFNQSIFCRYGSFKIYMIKLFGWKLFTSHSSFFDLIQ